jgi:VWFA-related protein
MNRPLLLAFALSLLTGSQAVAQEPQSPVQEAAEVVLVEVPVRVTGRDGAPIRNLTATDFELYDDGKKQAILGLDTIDLEEKAPADAGPKFNPAARRRFLLVFDLSFSRPKALLAARDAAKEFVLSGIADADLAAVATFSLENGLRLILNFSSDRVQLARAIDTLGLVTSLAKEKDPLEVVYDTTALRRTVGLETRSGRGGNAQDAALIESLETFKALGRAAQDRYARARIGTLFSSFDELANALDMVGGRKDIIYLSEGFESRLIVGTKDTDQEKEWITSGELWKIDSDKRFGSSAVQSELDHMTALFRRSDCTIHAVDLSGIRTDADVSSVAPARSDNSLFEFAHGTGGEVLRNSNDFRTELAEVIRRTNQVYVLAFRPTASAEGKYHELKVKTRASGARVSARAGYYERKGFRQMSPLERRLLAADVLANEIPVSDIPTRVLASAFAAGEDSAAVPVLVEIPGERFLAGATGDRVTAEIYVYAHDQDNRLRDFFVQAIGIDLAKNRERLQAGGLKYYGELRLPPGSYRLRTLVRNASTGRMGLTIFPLQVPSFATGEPYLLPPVFLESPGDWMSVSGRGKSASGGIEPSSYPFLALGAENMWPAALPRFRPGDASRVCLVAYNFGAGDSGELRLGSQILAADGHPLEGGKVAVLGKSLPDPDGKRMLLLSFTTPQGLGPGRYGLRIVLEDPATGQARHASAPFLVP